MEPLEDLLRRARADPDVAGVLLYGSKARGEPARDVDVALVRSPRAACDAWDLMMRYVDEVPGRLDVHVFEALPVYVRVRVLREGKVLHAADEGALYEAAFATAREWEDFRPFYEAYLEGAGLA